MDIGNYATTKEILDDFRKLKTKDEKGIFTLKIVEKYDDETCRALKATEMGQYFTLILNYLMLSNIKDELNKKSDDFNVFNIFR